MEDTIRQAVTALEARFPGWQCWVVYRAVSQPRVLWCSRRWDGSGLVIHAESSDDLAEAIEQEEAPDE